VHKRLDRQVQFLTSAILPRRLLEGPNLLHSTERSHQRKLLHVR
jgi:hypothetical protein